MATVVELRKPARFRMFGQRVEVCCEHVNHASIMDTVNTRHCKGITVRLLRCRECGNEITICTQECLVRRRLKDGDELQFTWGEEKTE